MAFCITFGTHDFTSKLEGYENRVAYCPKCHNWSGYGRSQWSWFTVCWVPIIPLSFGKNKEVACHICNFITDIANENQLHWQNNGQPQQPPPPGPNQPLPANYGYK